MAYDTGVQNPKYNNGMLEDPLKNLLRQSKKVHNNHTKKETHPDGKFSDIIWIVMSPHQYVFSFENLANHCRHMLRWQIEQFLLEQFH